MIELSELRRFNHAIDSWSSIWAALPGICSSPVSKLRIDVLPCTASLLYSNRAATSAGTGNGDRLINETEAEVVYLEVGDRTPGDEGSYPDDDLKALMVDGTWKFAHKDGSPY